MTGSTNASRRWLVFGLTALLGLAWTAVSEAQLNTGTGTNTGGGNGARSGGAGGTQQSTASSSSLETGGLQGSFGIGQSGGGASSAYKLGGGSSTANAANPLAQFYGNPLSYGLTGSTGARGGFGTPLFNSTSGGGNRSTSGLLTTGVGSRAGGTTGGSFGGTTGGGFGTTTGGGRTGGTAGGFGGTTGTFGGTTGGFGGGARTGGTTGGFGTTTGGFGGTAGAFGATGRQGGFGGSTLGGVGGQLGGRNAMGGTNNTNRRSTPYIVMLDEGLRPLSPQSNPVVASRLQADVQAVFTSSTAFPTAGTITVGAEGSAIVLQGNVANDRERRLAEAMIRLTPGVREVRNELQVVETAPPPKP